MAGCAGAAGDDDADGDDTFAVEGLKVIEISMEKGVFVIPLHLVCDAGVVAVVSHGEDIYLVVADSIDRISVDQFFDGDVVFAPSPRGKAIVVAGSVPSSTATSGLYVCDVVDVVLLKIRDKVSELEGECVLQDEICVTGDAVVVSVRKRYLGCGDASGEFGVHGLGVRFARHGLPPLDGLWGDRVPVGCGALSGRVWAHVARA